jgi:hypothetical protein
VEIVVRSIVVLCSVLFIFGVGCGSDDSSPTDAGLADASGDGGGSFDAAVSDGGVVMDMAVEIDMSTDAAERDSGESADVGADSGGDAGADTGGADMAETDGPCAASYTAREEVAGTVVACEGQPGTLNQCDAEAACGAGWHMCTATEYRTYFESVQPASAENATFWIASCVRNGGAPMAPSDTVCSDCTGTQTGTDEAVATSCVNALTVETGQLYVGVRAGTACTFVGEDAAGNDAFWNAQPARALQDGAFCCID